MPTSTRGSTRRRGRGLAINAEDAELFGQRIDAAATGSVSSAPTDGPATASHQPWSGPSMAVGRVGHELVAVGPGQLLPPLGFGLLGMRPVNPLPVRETKIHGPLLRDDTLARVRLNRWLDRAARGRLALIIGDAGFGKTTLLSDWASRTKRKAAWYRLEHDDRDWLTFIRHLVAAGRQVDAGFAPDTYALLCQLGPGGPTQAELTASLAREMAAFGSGDGHGFSVILDDFHSIERSEETDPVVAAMLEATGPGFSVILATRTAPELPPVHLRGRNAVNQIEDNELRFTAAETEALFSEAYGIPLEHEVAVELAGRTQGWAALLSLVRTRLEEEPSPDPRALVAQLSATEGDLYDFLAEEVLVDLPPATQEFLTRISVLEDVTLRSVQLIDTRDGSDVERSLLDAEKRRFLTRSGRTEPLRFHPLVKDFLAAQLEAKVGRAELQRQHRLLGETLETTDWKAAAMHFRAASEPAAAARVVDDAIPTIIASGAFEACIPLLDGTAGPSDRPGALILRSRVEFTRGNLRRALALAREAAHKAEGALSGTAQLNIAALEGIAGYPDDVVERAESALRGRLADSERRVAEASFLIRAAQVDGDLAYVADALRELANEQEFGGLRRYASVSFINLANVLIWLGDPRGAIKAALRAEIGLGERSGSVERVAASTARAMALVQLRKREEAELVLQNAWASSSHLGRIEADLERASIEAQYGSIELAETALERIDINSLPDAYRWVWELVAGTVALREGDPERACRHATACQAYGPLDVAGKFRVDLLVFRSSLASGRPIGDGCVELRRLAESLGSRPALVITALLTATTDPGPIGSELASLVEDERHAMSVVAENICERLADLTPAAYHAVEDEAAARPSRWSPALRRIIEKGGSARLRAATLLSHVGDSNDALFLRTLARSNKSLREPAAASIRRLAPPALIRDLGVVGLELGGKTLERTSRRKALALLCFLASRARRASTKDEALEALWPDCTPEMGLNSLHQAIFYVRRIFDPEFREGVSASYLTFDGEIVALDQGLVDSDSSRCWTLLRSTPATDLDATSAILQHYQGRFALDFMYEEWATDYRETLHAAVLGRTEASMAACIARGDPEAAIRIGIAIFAIDPAADAIELALLRSYKTAGRHAAAGEQYAHYAATLRDELGIEPPPYDTI